MNRQIRLVGIAMMALFLALFINLNYLQVVHAGSLNNSPLNGRRVVQEYGLQRGNIVSADGVTLAYSKATTDGYKYLRVYPTGSLFGQITGYFSFIYGSDGVEKYYDNTLTGANAPLSVPHSINGIGRLFTNNNKSQNLTLTLNDRLQSIAQTQLAGRVGSVVALDPKTGAILAMYSNPSYDPNQLAGHNPQQVQAAYKALSAVPGVFSPGSYRQRWFPGSTFKIVTASAVYDHDPALATKTYPHLSSLPLPQSTNLLHNYAGEVCGGQLLGLFTVSCDTGFGQIGLDLGGASLTAEAHSFGFDQTPPIDLPFPAQSAFPAASSFPRNLPTLAFSALGQQNVQATPLEMAMVAGAVADGGTIMTPHVLDKVTNSQDRVVRTYQPKPWLQATSASTAAQVTKLMQSVIDSPNGTGGAARIPGVAVAGKTGTAQTGTGKVDAWFAAFAPASNPSIAVAVVVPDQPFGTQFQGGTVAAPIAKAMIQAYLQAGGSPGTTTTPSGTPSGGTPSGGGPSGGGPSSPTSSTTTSRS